MVAFSKGKAYFLFHCIFLLATLSDLGVGERRDINTTLAG